MVTWHGQSLSNSTFVTPSTRANSLATTVTIYKYSTAFREALSLTFCLANPEMQAQYLAQEHRIHLFVLYSNLLNQTSPCIRSTMSC